MKNNTPLLLLITVLFAFAGCKKSGTSPTNKTTAKADIYVAGELRGTLTYAIAAYWKNESMTKLVADTTSPSSAAAIAVVGNDVYIAGYITGSNSHTVAVMWKNGILTKLTDGTSDAVANSIAINGNDVYVSGNFTPTTGSVWPAVYWKNGALVSVVDTATLSNSSGISANSNGVFLAGIHLDDDINVVGTGGYLKNGSLETIGHYSQPLAIAVSGNDVYLAGNNYFPNLSLFGAAYWKNGVATKLTDSQTNGNATGIALSGNDVYVSGNVYGDDKQFRPCYWKNGLQTILDGNEVILGVDNSAHAITVQNGTVYVAGSDNGNAGYWINGAAFNQLAKNSVGLAITVIPK